MINGTSGPNKIGNDPVRPVWPILPWTFPDLCILKKLYYYKISIWSWQVIFFSSSRGVSPYTSHCDLYGPFFKCVTHSSGTFVYIIRCRLHQLPLILFCKLLYLSLLNTYIPSRIVRVYTHCYFLSFPLLSNVYEQRSSVSFFLSFSTNYFTTSELPFV